MSHVRMLLDIVPVRRARAVIAVVERELLAGPDVLRRQDGHAVVALHQHHLCAAVGLRAAPPGSLLSRVCTALHVARCQAALPKHPRRHLHKRSLHSQPRSFPRLAASLIPEACTKNGEELPKTTRQSQGAKCLEPARAPVVDEAQLVAAVRRVQHPVLVQVKQVGEAGAVVLAAAPVRLRLADQLAHVLADQLVARGALLRAPHTVRGQR